MFRHTVMSAFLCADWDQSRLVLAFGLLCTKNVLSPTQTNHPYRSIPSEETLPVLSAESLLAKTVMRCLHGSTETQVHTIRCYAALY
jgi:hypothetical protein